MSWILHSLVHFVLHTETEEGYNVLATAVASLLAVFAVEALVDNLVVRHLFAKTPTTRYFALHVIFNCWVIYVVWPDAVEALANPVTSMTEHHWVHSAVLSTGGISGFHIYHLLLFTNLTTEDVWHHVVSCMIVPLVAIFCPFGRVVSLSNLGMCGIPGGIDYALLVLVKMRVLNTMTEKRINRYLNLVLRWPLQLITTYLIGLSWCRGGLGHINPIVLAFMFLADVVHCFNAVYYADKVVGNYWVRLNENQRKHDMIRDEKVLNSPMGTRRYLMNKYKKQEAPRQS